MRIPILILISLLSIAFLSAQTGGDLPRSVPCFFDYQSTNDEAVLRWSLDPVADQYLVYRNETPGINNTLIQAILPGTQDSFVIEDFVKGEVVEYFVEKRENGATLGVGSINLGIEAPLVHWRGNALILIESSLSAALQNEIALWRMDLLGDGWASDTMHVDINATPQQVKARIQNWYASSSGEHRTLILLGHIPVPYSGDIFPDGHTDHAGAWPSDGYYGDMDGAWTDASVNNTSASRAENRNIPGDGKFDQSTFPGAIELQVGRIDFSGLPAFGLDEIGLTRKYLNKNHDFRNKEFDFPRRAVIENNFIGFAEGFGQNGFNNFTPMFGPGAVAYGDYDEVLKTEEYLCAYACGPGSYRSAGGIGTTANLYAAHELNAVFVMNFGSYFGDWDVSDSFLRAALGSGMILTNAWAGRPNWHLTHMALGKHIGYSAALSQFNNLYPSGFGARSIHAALMGDPTLRLHTVLPPDNVTAEIVDGLSVINWEESADADAGYVIYSRIKGEDSFTPLIENWMETSYTHNCIEAGEYEYMIKAVKLEKSASGSYYNTSIGKLVELEVASGTLPVANFDFQQQWEQITLTNNSNAFAESFVWDFGDGNTSTEVNPSHQYAEGGSYELCLIALKRSCSSDTSCMTIDIESSLPTIQSQIIEPLCYGDSTGSIEIFWSGGDGNPSFEWSDNQSGSTRTNLIAGEYELRVISENGTEESYSYQLSQPDSISVGITTTTSSGNDGLVILDISGGTVPYSIDWGDAIIDTTAFAPGDYQVIVYDDNGCNVTLFFTIEITTSLNEPNGNEEILVYPNPFSNSALIKSSQDILRYRILNYKGLPVVDKTVRDKQILIEKPGQAGMYFIEVHTRSNIELIKVLVQ